MALHHTHVDPTKPTTTFVTSGPYRFSRNLLYLNLTITCLGISLALDTWIALFLTLFHFNVVGREERYLEKKFEDTSADARVRRYI